MLTSPKLIAPLHIALGIALNGTRRRPSASWYGQELALCELVRLGLPDDLPRLHVRPQTLERGRAERARLRPLAKLDVGDEPRLDEDRVLGRLATVEGALGTLQRCQLAGEHGERLLGEA